MTTQPEPQNLDELRKKVRVFNGRRVIMSNLVWDIIHELDHLERQAALCKIRGLHSHDKIETVYIPCPKATLKAFRIRLKELIKDSGEE